MSNPITEAYNDLLLVIESCPDAMTQSDGVGDPNEFLDFVDSVRNAYITFSGKEAPVRSAINPHPYALASCYQSVLDGIRENPGAINEDGVNFVAQFNDLCNRLEDALPTLLAGASEILDEMEERHEMREGYYGEVHPCERDDMSDEYERDFDYPY